MRYHFKDARMVITKRQVTVSAGDEVEILEPLCVGQGGGGGCQMLQLRQTTVTTGPGNFTYDIP